MSDLLHDHLTLGLRPGCPACDQLVEDLQHCAEAALVAS